MTIPAFNHRGLIPPYGEASNPTGLPRSPYASKMSEVVLRFATSPSRKTILTGLIQYRSALYLAGLTVGFQWLDGSFTEQVETTQHRAPNDIDVVTFPVLPSNFDQQRFADIHANLQSPVSKQEFKVDGYIVPLNLRPDILVQQTAYWYSVWAHQKETSEWKGFIQIPLDEADDIAARNNLAVEIEPKP